MQTKRFTSGERIYAITILLLGLGIWIYCAWRYPVQTSDFSPLSLFLSFLILATLTIRFGLNVKPDLTLYVDTALLVSATLRYSPMVNLMIAGIASVASLKGRESLSSAKYYLDIGQRLTYVGISALFLNLFGLSPWIPVDFMSWVVMLVTLSLISFIRATINSGYLSLQSGESFFLTYKRQVISTFWPDTALFGVGIVIILLVADNPWRLLLIVIPSFIVFLTLNQLTRVQGKLEKEVRERERVEKILRDSISEEKHSQDIQKTIYQISQAANAAQNLDELFPAIHSILGGLLPAENFFIALIDPVSEILQFPYFVDQYDPPPSPRKMGRGLTEYLIRAGTPIFANPEVFDNLVKEGKVDNVGTPSVDWLGVPLKVEQRIIGGMVVQTYEEQKRYGQNELDIMEFVSSQVAMAIERKRVEQAMRESERFLASIYSSIQDGISILDTDLNIISVNATMERWYAHASPLVGKKCYEAYHGRMEACTVCPSQKTLKQRTAEYEAVPKVGPGGTLAGWLDIFSFPFLDANTGQLKGVIEYVRDITEQRQVETALRSSESRYRNLFEDSPVSMWEEDYSQAKAYLQQLVQQGVTNLHDYLQQNPETLAKCISLMKVNDVNKATLKLYQAKTKEELLSHLDLIYTPDSFPVFLDEFLAITEGKTEYKGEGIDYDLKGNRHNIQIYWSCAAGYEETLSKIIVTILDVTQQKEAENALLQRANELEVLHSVARLGVEIDNEDELIERATEIIGATLYPDWFGVILIDETDQQLHTHSSFRGLDEESKKIPIPLGKGVTGQVALTGKPWRVPDVTKEPAFINIRGPETGSELCIPLKIGGTVIGVINIESISQNAFSEADERLVTIMTGQLATAIERLRTEEKERQQAKELSVVHAETLRHMDELAVLVRVSSALRIAQTRDDMLPIVLEQICQLLKINSAAIVLTEENTGRPHVIRATGGWLKLTGFKLMDNKGLINQVILSGQPAHNIDIRLDAQQQRYEHLINEDTISDAIPLFAQGKTLGSLWVGRTTDFTHDEIRLLTAVADIAANAFHRSSLHEQTRKHAEQIAHVSAIGRELTQTLDLPGIYHRLSTAIFEILSDVKAVVISRFSPQWETITCVYGLYYKQPIDVSEIQELNYHPSGSDFQSEVIRTQAVLIVNDISVTSQNTTWPVIMGDTHPQAALFVPLLAKGDVLGVIEIQSDTNYRFTKDDADILTLLANTGAIALENARLFFETEKRLRRLAALRAMDLAISSSFDLNVTLNVLLDQVITQLGMDAADVLLFDEYTKSLEYAAGRGFRSNAITRSKIKLNEDIAGHAAIERQLISSKDYPQLHLHTPRLERENFVISYAMPLITKGQIKGVLEVFNRSPFIPDTEWLDFLETLAHDTAIAIDNASLFSDLQRTNLELTLAYDITLESWSRIFEMYAHEPEGHIQRESELTMELARALGIDEAEVADIRRGVLLHDIGMLAVPDYIIHKPGSLTTPEWEVVKSHPVYAHQILSSIPYLHPALDIAYCHHEKWDGTGYPRGLMGEQIPLSARLFAVVDVWNAMLSPRPYHQPCSVQEAIEYLRSQAGKHFDPLLVDTFLNIISTK